MQMAPASITKLLTALVVVENSDLDALVTFSRDAMLRVDSDSGNKLDLAEGDVLSVRDCLYVMILQSSNQTSNALAEHVAGKMCIRDSMDMLGRRVSGGLFRQELFYLLAGLTLKVPPLRSCREDLKQLIEQWVQEGCEQYSRYHVLTKGAQKALEDYPWPGNLLQLESFMKRLILTAERRSIDEIMIHRLLQSLYPDSLLEGGALPEVSDAGRAVEGGAASLLSLIHI